MKNQLLTFAVFISTTVAQTLNLAELIQSQPDLSTLGDALSIVPDLAETVSGLKGITILAPTNSAFEALLAQDSSEDSNAIRNRNAEGVAAILSYHVLNGTFVSSDFTNVPTFVNSLLKPSVKVMGHARTNVTGGQNVGLVLDGKDAQILSGELQSCKVVQADIQQIPGITIHKIDHLEVDAALGAVVTAGLAQTLDTVADLTIFIPNNDAFVSAASAFANASVETLTSVLTYHAIAGAVIFASDITNGSVATVNGNKLAINVGTDGTVYVDNAKVVLPNIQLSNGVAHIIDTVLNPADEVDAPKPAPSPTPAFSGASAVGTNVPFTESAPTASTTVSIPAIATTAKFVSAGGANTSATNAPAPSPTPSEFPGGASNVRGALSGAAIGLGMALML